MEAWVSSLPLGANHEREPDTRWNRCSERQNFGRGAGKGGAPSPPCPTPPPHPSLLHRTPAARCSGSDHPDDSGPVQLLHRDRCQRVGGGPSGDGAGKRMPLTLLPTPPCLLRQTEEALQQASSVSTHAAMQSTAVHPPPPPFLPARCARSACAPLSRCCRACCGPSDARSPPTWTTTRCRQTPCAPTPRSAGTAGTAGRAGTPHVSGAEGGAGCDRCARHVAPVTLRGASKGPTACTAHVSQPSAGGTWRRPPAAGPCHAVGAPPPRHTPLPRHSAAAAAAARCCRRLVKR